MVVIQESSLQYEVPNSVIFIALFVFIGIIAAFYVLRSLGLYKLAKNNGYAKAYIAWIPCVWTWLLFKLVGEQNIFGISFGKFATLLCVICSAAMALPVISNFFNYFPLVGYYFESLGSGGQIIINMEQGYIATYPSLINYFDTPAINVIVNIIDILAYVLDFVSVVVQAFAFIYLFRTFWPEHYILASILSVCGLFAPFVFAVRNRKPIKNYVEYMRKKYYYNNPYGPNPYGRTGDYSAPKPQDPFEEFEDKDKTNSQNDEPFSEFDNRK